MKIYFVLFLFVLYFGCKTDKNAQNTKLNNINRKAPINTGKLSDVPVYTYEIVNTFKHDPNAFTEGLFFRNGFLYESTGGYKESELRKVELETGKIVQQFKLSKDSFGEGTTVLNGKIYQLTWQQGKCFVYDAETFKLLKEFNFQGDGWGLTNDGTHLFMTDSTHIIRVINPETFQTVKNLVVLREDNKPLLQINELEYIKGEIWSNVWHSEDPNILGKPNYIARIDPQTGKIVGWVDLNKISPDDVAQDSQNTLNGIAYDPEKDRIFVTGKKWKKLFEIRVVGK